jgi:hypothetical protein
MNHIDPYEAADLNDDEFGDRHLDELPPKSDPDFVVQNHGSIFILHAYSEAAREWVSEHIPEDALTWGRNGTVVEHRYIADIVDGIRNDGLTVI